MSEPKTIMIVRVIEAGSGAVACSRLRDSRIDLVAVDMTMPELGGETLIRWIRQHDEFAHVRILPLSAKSLDALANLLKPRYR